MPSGWTRLLFENFEFPFEVVYPPMLDAGNLREKYDVLVFNNSGLSTGGGGRGGRGGGGGAGGGRGAGPAGQVQRDPADNRPAPIEYPEEYTRRRGAFTATSLKAVQDFVAQGGTVIAIGGAADSAIEAFGLPLGDHLVENGQPLGREKFYVPGSVLRVAVDPANPVAHGYGTTADIFFDASPTWKMDASAGAAGVTLRKVAWFDSETPLKSGWAWGQNYLKDGIQMAEATVGKGRVMVFGNDLLFRTQPHGNYRFFFNSLYLSVAPDMR